MGLFSFRLSRSHACVVVRVYNRALGGPFFSQVRNLFTFFYCPRRRGRQERHKYAYFSSIDRCRYTTEVLFSLVPEKKENLCRAHPSGEKGGVVDPATTHTDTRPAERSVWDEDQVLLPSASSRASLAGQTFVCCSTFIPSLPATRPILGSIGSRAVGSRQQHQQQQCTHPSIPWSPPTYRFLPVSRPSTHALVGDRLDDKVSPC